jgi:CheY-like chemotaxis protein
MNTPSLKVVAVSDDALRSELLDALLVDESDLNVVVVESIPHAYSRIRQIKPDVVVVYMGHDDLSACQLLSMLKIDRTLRGIPVVTCATGPECVASRALHGGAAVGVGP